MKKNDEQMKPIEKFSSIATRAAGSSAAFLLAVFIVVVWGAAGPFFHFSEIWQMVINTSTTIITFLMVFLIQKSQNKDSLAIQLKLNELLAAHEFASNRLVNAENITEDELKTIQNYYAKLARKQKKKSLCKLRILLKKQKICMNLKKILKKILNKILKRNDVVDLNRNFFDLSQQEKFLE